MVNIWCGVWLVIRDEITYLNPLIFLATQSIFYTLHVSLKEQLTFRRKVVGAKSQVPFLYSLQVTSLILKTDYERCQLSKKENRNLQQYFDQIWACDKIAPEMKLASETFLPPAHIYLFFFFFWIKESNILTCDYTSGKKNILQVKQDAFCGQGEFLKCQSWSPCTQKAIMQNQTWYCVLYYHWRKTLSFVTIVEYNYYDTIITWEK